MTVADFVDLLEKVRRRGRGWVALCPAHEDRTPSLSVAEGDDGRILVRCFAGCTVDKITASIGLRVADLFPGPAIDWSRFVPRTPEERQAAERRRLRRQVRALERERSIALRVLYRASLLVAIAYSDDPDAVLDRLWQGAVADVEREASAAADAYAQAAAA